MLKTQIAEKLEQAFSELGFTEPSVSQLQKLSGVSLRTLYKYYPSKEAMIVAALEHRHERYLALINAEKATGTDSVLAAFTQLENWMKTAAPNGCMSTLALASFPENQTIKDVVTQHKSDVCEVLGRLAGDKNKAKALFLIHEGISMSHPVLGQEMSDIGKLLVRQLLSKHDGR